MKMLMDEILELAWAEGVNLTEEDRDDIIEILVNFPPDKKMSMLQDYEAGRPIEIDEYAGEVIRLGRKHGIVSDEEFSTETLLEFGIIVLRPTYRGIFHAETILSILVSGEARW